LQNQLLDYFASSSQLSARYNHQTCSTEK